MNVSIGIAFADTKAEEGGGEGGRERDAANHSGRGKSIKSEPAVGHGRGNQVLMYGLEILDYAPSHTNEMWKGK